MTNAHPLSTFFLNSIDPNPKSTQWMRFFTQHDYTIDHCTITLTLIYNMQFTVISRFNDCFVDNMNREEGWVGRWDDRCPVNGMGRDESRDGGGGSGDNMIKMVNETDGKFNSSIVYWTVFSALYLSIHGPRFSPSACHLVPTHMYPTTAILGCAKACEHILS